MSAVAKQEAREVQVAPERTGNQIMPLIAQAVRDGAPMDMIRELRQMMKEEAQEQAEAEFNKAMRAAQEEMGPVAANQNNTQTRSKYADYYALDKALRPIYTRHGFSVSFNQGDDAPDGHIKVVAYVSHEAGHTRTYRADMPADGKGAKGGDVMTKTHAAGAAMSYGMRYLLKMIFNVAVGEDDRDGNAPSEPVEKITPEQRDQIIALISEARTTTENWCRVAKVEAVPDLPAKDFERAVNGLRQRIANLALKAQAQSDARSKLDQQFGGSNG